MSSIEIQQPLIDGGIRSVNFFNGRLLSGEDLSAEQEANREGHQRLGRATGQGVVSGLEVIRTPPPPPGAHGDSTPKVTVKKGVGINSLGQTLLLYDDIDVVLVHTLSGSPSSTAMTQQATFRSLQPAPQGNYTFGEGIYLLTLAPASQGEGFSPVSEFSSEPGGGTVAACNTRYRIDAVKFSLYQLTTLSSGLIGDANHVRNNVAYACFGYQDPQSQTHSFGPVVQSDRLLGSLPFDLTADVPLAMLYWTSDGTLKFIDTWSVRRRLTHTAFTVPWSEAMGDQRLAEGEAMFLQFQNHIDDLQTGLEEARRNITPGAVQTAQAATNTLNTLSADQLFSYLPAAGYLPVGDTSFNWQTFLGPFAPPTLSSVDGAFLRLILHNSFYEEPIQLHDFTLGTKPGQALVDVYQDPSQPDFVLFARSTTGRMRITVDAQGYLPANILVSLGLGQQTELKIPLKQKVAGKPGVAGIEQPPLYLDVDGLTRPALGKIRFSVVQQPASFSTSPQSQMIKLDPLPKNVANWLNGWKTWLNSRYPDQGIDGSTPVIYINDYYEPPKPGHVPEEPSAYAVFGTFAVPLLITVSYYTTPISVPLAKAGIHGLTDDTIQDLAGIGILYVDQVAGAWSELIADATGQPFEFGRYLISDALSAVDNIDTRRLYYKGINDRIEDTLVEEILEQMALSDDVALANADQDELGENLKSEGFANRLIMQARQAVPPEHWSLESLGVKTEQIPSLKQIGISSKGQFAKRAETNEGHKQLESGLQLDPQAIDQLQTKAYQQMTTSSLVLIREKNLILLPNVNAQIATKLAAANITTLDQLSKVDKAKLMEMAGLSEDAAEDLKKEAERAKKEGQEVVKLASVTKDVANALDTVLQVKTISQLFEKGEPNVSDALKESRGERFVHFVHAVFDGIRGAGR